MLQVKTFFFGYTVGFVCALCLLLIYRRAIKDQSKPTNTTEQRVADDARRAEQSVRESRELNERARELAERSASILEETRQLLEDCKSCDTNSDSN